MNPRHARRLRITAQWAGAVAALIGFTVGLFTAAAITILEGGR